MKGPDKNKPTENPLTREENKLNMIQTKAALGYGNTNNHHKTTKAERQANWQIGVVIFLVIAALVGIAVALINPNLGASKVSAAGVGTTAPTTQETTFSDTTTTTDTSTETDSTTTDDTTSGGGPTGNDTIDGETRPLLQDTTTPRETPGTTTEDDSNRIEDLN